ncbi:cupin domain-containing protein [Streptomyces sp. NPDC002055]|uniref:cupin domain-containing protein n=1 Tax=Streptomyces sp. NPDC002055 TaxID=3154534 RepID=UPI003317362F
MPVIRHAEARRTETPNAVMTTLASPTQGPAGELAVWRVAMRPGQAGPEHTFDAEQVWTVLEGGARIDLGGEAVTVTSGDTVVMPAGLPRQVFCDGPEGLTAVVASRAGGQVRVREAAGPDADGCAVRDGERLVPAWIA